MGTQVCCRSWRESLTVYMTAMFIPDPCLSERLGILILTGIAMLIIVLKKPILRAILVFLKI